LRIVLHIDSRPHEYLRWLEQTADGWCREGYQSRWYSKVSFPGPACLAQGKMAVKGDQPSLRSLGMALDTIDAKFVYECGPYKFVPTSSLEKHLTIHYKR